MVRRHVWMSAAVLLTLALLTIAGCAGRHCNPMAMAPGLSPGLLPASARGEFPIETLAADSLQTSGATAAIPAYRLLLAHQSQCLAVEASTFAAMLDLESGFTIEKVEAKKLSPEKVQKAAALKVDALTYLALEDRNRSAGKALSLYYRLGEAEASADLLLSMLTQVSDALAKARALKAKGLQVSVDETALHRQQLELQTQNVKLQLQIDQLNGELRRQLAIEPWECDWRFWPVDAFHLAGRCVAVDEAVAVGLANRPILLLLNMLQTELSEGDPATVRGLLSTINNLLGQDAKCPCLKELVAILCGTSAEQQLRLQQLAVYRADREREVVEDIRQAARTIQAQREVVLLARQKVESWLGRVKEAEEKESKGLGSFAATTDARVNWLKARQTVAEEITNLQRAWVQLRQAQGVLPLECSSSTANLHSRLPEPHITPVPDIEPLPRPRTVMPK